MMSCDLFIFSFLIYFVVHTASHKNQNCFESSDLVPLKTCNLISSAIFILRGGRGMSKGRGTGHRGSRRRRGRGRARGRAKNTLAITGFWLL